MSDRQLQAKGKSRAWSWLRRLLMLGILAAIAAAVFYWWYRPTLKKIVLELVNRTSTTLVYDADTVSRVSFDQWEAKGVRLRLRTGGAEVLTLSSLKMRASIDDLRHQVIRELTLDGPQISVTDALIEAFSPTPQTEATPSSAPWTIGRGTITGGAVRVDLREYPLADGQLDAQLSAIILGVSPGASADRQKIRLRDLRVRVARESDEAFVRLPLVEAEFSWRELREEKRLAGLRLDRPEVRFDARVQRALQSMPASAGGEVSAEAPWRVGRLQLTDGRLRLEELGPGIPAMTFGLEVDLGNLALGVDRAVNDTVEQKVTVRGLELRAPGGDGEPFARIPVLRARFTWRELLEQRRLAALEIERPNVHFDAAVQRAFRAETAGAPPSTNPPPPYRIGALWITGGNARLDGLGPGLPSFAFIADAALSEVSLGFDGGTPSEALQALSIRDLALGFPGRSEPFLRVPAISSTFTWRGLLEQKRLDTVRIEQPQLHFDPAVRSALAAGAASEPPAAGSKPAAAYRVGELELVGGKVHLADLGLGVPPIDFGLETAFHDLALSLEGEALRDSLQTIELHNIGLQSPVDPFVSVLNLKTIFIRFTPAGLWKREIEQVEIINPVLSVGEDLFWYIDRVQGREAGAAPDPRIAEPPADERGWTVNRFDATAGQLVLAFDQRPKLPLPLPFETHARHLNFNKLSELRLTLDLVVPEQDYLYPEYGLSLRRVSGRLQFSLPPAQHANNLVHTLQVAEVQWKDYRARDLFLDVTFEEKAIHGDLGGKAYAGYVRGAFDFALDPAATWSGWISGTRVDLKPLTGAFAPEKFSLSGPADFRASVSAHAREIERFEGDFRGQGPGELHIGKLDEIIRDLPPEWTRLKRALTRIGLETMRDFNYDNAHGDFRFLGRTGRSSLDLRGPGGSRRLEALYHDGPAPATSPDTPRARVSIR
ncbi:MAG: hypothetical protein QOE70_2977 [Chthoniobacter sp.]|jgi:hypothetical protein|nr:hypothetical protein [Chthoniobacter sp.]